SLIHKADQRMYSYKRASKQQQQTMAAANDLAPENSTADGHSISQSQSVDKAVE
ncbi:MAG TPA: GGDEF domain-containing protein, partial [Shewanella sp.]|nr:GGDEF domain-containing protein [Shewanella sp.]